MTTTTTTLVDNHGATGYKKGCRCDTCKDAKAAARLRQVAARKASTHEPVALTHLTFSVSCFACGGAVEHENASAPTEHGTRSTAVLRCLRNGCRKRWFILLTGHPFEG